ncbi:MAG: ATP-binding protein [Spirochaetota bacterium]
MRPITKRTKKLLISVISTFLILILLSGFIGLYIIKNSYTETVHYIQAVNLARESQVYFQNQLYSWNNIIFQGENFSEYQANYHSFTRFSDKVQDTLFNLKLLCSNFKDIPDEIAELRLTHKQITMDYMSLIEKLVESNFKTKKEIIGLSKGKDEIAVSEMDYIVAKIEDAADKEIERINNFYFSLTLTMLIILSVYAILLGLYFAKKILTIQDQLEIRIKERTNELTKANADLKKEISERIKTEENLAGEKELLAVTLRSIGDGVITTDLLGKIMIMNKVAEKLTGWTLNEAKGKDLADIFRIINELTRKPGQNPVERVLSTGNVIELSNHTLLISRDGSEKVITESGAPINDKNSKTIGVVLVFSDITEKQAIKENLQRADKLESLGILAGGIAHDFNNLLSVIYGYIELSKDAGPGDADYKEYLETALQSFNKAKDLTHQLLTFAKGGLPVRKTGELKSILMECSKFALSGANVSCDLNISEDLWLCDFDENQLGQVINNLLINAKQAMPGRGKITITAKNTERNELIRMQKSSNTNNCRFIKISIADTGTGIPADILPKIFDPFFTTKKEGTGLGLATSYSIIQKHEGFIRVESEPGHGTTFHIFLPASAGNLADSISRSRSVHSGSGTLIIMDDKDNMRDVTEEMLKEMGYMVIKTSNGNETLDQYLSSVKNNIHIKAMLLDLTNSAGMGGLETIAVLRSNGAEMPVFATSGYSEDPVMSQPVEYGFTDSITKPFRKSELSELLNRHLK